MKEQYPSLKANGQGPIRTYGVKKKERKKDSVKNLLGEYTEIFIKFPDIGMPKSHFAVSILSSRRREPAS